MTQNSQIQSSSIDKFFLLLLLFCLIIPLVFWGGVQLVDRDEIALIVKINRYIGKGSHIFFFHLSFPNTLGNYLYLFY